MLLDRGLLTQEGNVYRPTGSVETLEVPGDAPALIAARLDSLTPDERRLVQDGSVLGKTFTKPGLAALTGLTDTELEPLLVALVRKEILSIQADPRSPERGQYSFLQDIVKHVAYETISKKERKTKHLACRPVSVIGLERRRRRDRRGRRRPLPRRLRRRPRRSGRRRDPFDGARCSFAPRSAPPPSERTRKHNARSSGRWS